MSHGEGIVLLILAETPLGLSKGQICLSFLERLPNTTDYLGGQWNEVLRMSADQLSCPTSVNSGAYTTNRLEDQYHGYVDLFNSLFNQ